MMIHDITGKVARRPRRKRVGRGEGSGLGKTSGRGHKGAKSRSGWKSKPGYEGGQMPFFRRLPKRGFSNVQFEQRYAVVNLKSLEERCESGTEVTLESLAKLGVVRDTKTPLKVLGEGDLTKKLRVTAAKFSAAAKRKIEAAGGTATEIAPSGWKRTEGKPKEAKAKS
jgi:large subunit ribosomal protein L15